MQPYHLPVDVDAVDRMHKQGLCAAAIGRHLGVEPRVISRRLRALGYESPGSGRHLPKVRTTCMHCGCELVLCQSKVRKFCSRKCAYTYNQQLAKSRALRLLEDLTPTVAECYLAGRTIESIVRETGRTQEFIRECLRMANVALRSPSSYSYPSGTSIELCVGRWLQDIGLPYKPQGIVAKYHVDLLLLDCPVVIECDGDYWHSLPGAADRDARKNLVLQQHGYTVLRLKQCDIIKRPRWCRNKICYAVRQSLATVGSNHNRPLAVRSTTAPAFTLSGVETCV